MKTFFALCAFSTIAAAQPIGVGIKVGVPLTDAFEIGSSSNATYTAKTKRWIVGPQVELRLPAGFAIEADALYTKLNFSSASSLAGSVASSVTDADSWEFPVLLKKKFGGANAVAASVRPFVSTGASFRRLMDIRQIRTFATGGTPLASSNPSELRDKNSVGFVIGGGLEIRALIFRISPEVRFTRWGADNFASGVAGVFNTNRNQGQLLVGFHF